MSAVGCLVLFFPFLLQAVALNTLLSDGLVKADWLTFFELPLVLFLAVLFALLSADGWPLRVALFPFIIVGEVTIRYGDACCAYDAYCEGCYNRAGCAQPFSRRPCCNRGVYQR